MKSKKLFRALGEVREDFILEAAPGRKPAEKKKDKKRTIRFLIPAAVCTAAVIAALVLLPWQNLLNLRTNIRKVTPDQLLEQKETETPKNLTMIDGLLQLKVPPVLHESDGEILWAYDSSEIAVSSPWTPEADIETLPVYFNPTYTNYEESVSSAENDYESEEAREKKQQLLLKAQALTASALHIGADTIEIEEELSETFYEGTPAVKIGLSDHNQVVVYISHGLELPEEYKDGFASRESATACGQSLIDTYADYFFTENDNAAPKAFVCGGDYSLEDGEPVRKGYSVGFYNSSENDRKDLLNYSFGSVRADDNDSYTRVIIDAKPLYKKVGEYPIITVREAQKILAGGTYLSNTCVDFPGEEKIRKVELIYRDSKAAQYTMPYYRFLVELPENAESGSGEMWPRMLQQGLHAYGAYYVPAIEQKYLELTPGGEVYINGSDGSPSGGE